MRYDIRSIIALFILIILAVIVVKILKGIISLLVPAALIIIAGYIVYILIRKKR